MIPRHLRGSTKHCPKCGSSRVGYDPTLHHEGYGPGLASCLNCHALWEPFLPSQIWDPDDPLCSFKEPCNNCAFRPGSHEQADTEKWKRTLDSLKCGGVFYCHKGVPIDPDAENGFAYPHRAIVIEVDGKQIEKQVPNARKLRMCRGFLKAWPALMRAFERESKNGTLDVLAIRGDPEGHPQ